jgi:hypothetical protein
MDSTGGAAHPANELAVLAGLLLCATVTGSLSNEALLARHFHFPTLLGVLGPLATAISGAAAYAHGGWTRKAPLGAHFACGVVIFVSVWCGARSQLYLPFAIFLGAKSARLVATMGVGAVWLNKRYSAADVACACLAIVGLALALGLARPPRDPHDPAVASAAAAAVLGDDDDTHSGGGDGTAGIPGAAASLGRGHVLIAISLLADGIVSNHQEALMWQHGASSQELSALSHGTACGLMLLSALFDGHTLGGLATAAASPRLLGWLAVLAVSGWASTLLVLSIMAGYGNARASFILTCAKALAVGVSLAILPKPVDPSQLVGITLVLASVMASTLIKHHPAAAAAAAAAAKDSEADSPLAAGDVDDDVHIHERAEDSGGDMVDTTAMSGRAAVPQQPPLLSPPPLHRFVTLGSGSALDAAIPEADNETVATYDEDDGAGTVDSSPGEDNDDDGFASAGGPGARPVPPQRPVLDVLPAAGGGGDYTGDADAVTPPLRSADRQPLVGAASVLARSTSAPTAEQRAVASGVTLASAGAPRFQGGRRRRIASSQDLVSQVARADTVGAVLPPSAAVAAGLAALASAPAQPAAGPAIPPARRPSLSLTHVRTASSRTLQRIATASRLALDVLSEVGGVERPAVVYDSLSPGARPAVIYSFAAGGGGGGGLGTGAAATRRSVRSFRLDGSPGNSSSNTTSSGSQAAAGR